MRQDDAEWYDTVKWIINALIIAEELGVTKKNAKKMARSAGDNPNINRLLGTEGDFGAMIGLDKQWAVRAIAEGGNYGEIFDRHLGSENADWFGTRLERVVERWRHSCTPHRFAKRFRNRCAKSLRKSICSRAGGLV